MINAWLKGTREKTLAAFVLQHTDFGASFFTELTRGITETVSGDDGVSVHEQDDGSNSTGPSVGGPGAVWG